MMQEFFSIFVRLANDLCALQEQVKCAKLQSMSAPIVHIPEFVDDVFGDALGLLCFCRFWHRPQRVEIQ